MKRFLAMMAVVALIAMPAMAERVVIDSSQIHTVAVDATLGPVTNNGRIESQTVTVNEAVQGRVGGMPIYDNFPSFLGGSGGSGIGTFALFDWNESGATVGFLGNGLQWEDYVTIAAAPGKSVITCFAYGYSDSGTAPDTHTIRIFTGLPAPVTGSFATIATGVFSGIATFVLPNMPNGPFTLVSITGLNIPVGTASFNAYVGFEEAGAGNVDDNAFWLTGGVPGVGGNVSYTGLSTEGEGILIYHVITGGPFASPGLVYNVPFTLTTQAGAPLNANMGFQVFAAPEPMTIGLVAMGGLLALRRRRAA